MVRADATRPDVGLDRRLESIANHIRLGRMEGVVDRYQVLVRRSVRTKNPNPIQVDKRAK